MTQIYKIYKSICTPIISYKTTIDIFSELNKTMKKNGNTNTNLNLYSGYSTVLDKYI